MKVYLFTFVLLAVFEIIQDTITQKYLCKKCKYNCDECKYWPCPYHSCERKRKKLEEAQKVEDKQHVYVDDDVQNSD